MKTIYFVIFSIFLAQAVFAEDCSDYPQKRGINVILVDGGTKILSTAIETLKQYDAESRLEAIFMAEKEAKAEISFFFTEAQEESQVEQNNQQVAILNFKFILSSSMTYHNW